jgi:hypothetical protein
MKNIIKSFARNSSGNFGIMFGLVLTPVLMCMGAAVDYAGFKRMESRMTLASEAAMLAGSKAVVKMREDDYALDGKYDLSNAQIVAELDKVFKPFFEANFSAAGYNLGKDQYKLEYIEADNNTKVRVSMDYDTAVMGIVGKKTIKATREMLINLKVQPNNYVIDIVMCIDATGSMQNTLNAVKASAMTFNNDLREQIGVGTESQKVKIRVRPMFYRDWEEGLAYKNAMTTYNTAYAQYLVALHDWETGGEKIISGTNWTQMRTNLQNQWNSSSWYYQNGKNWKESTKASNPKTHKRVDYQNNWNYFTSVTELNTWVDGLIVADTVFIKPKTGPKPTEPTKPVNYGLTAYDGFIDLDPNSTSGFTRLDQNNKLTSFLGSQTAWGGNDLPESAGACLNEAVRSNWYDIKSAESREYFKVHSGDAIISEKDPVPTGTYTKITNIPVVVFWSDAAIQSLQKSRDYISATTPVTYSAFQNLWNGAIPAGDPESSKGVAANGTGRPVIDNRYRMMIHFGPQGISGFSTLYTWDKVFYGGSLSTGNKDGVKVIAKKILEAIPDMLRVGT